MLKKFYDFVSKKERDAKKHLHLIQKMLENHHFHCVNYLEEDDPYIYCFDPTGSNTFAGIRIFSIGKQLAFRVQNQDRTHPFGRSYPLDLEEMFSDLMGDEDIDEEKATKQVMEDVIKQIQKFFIESSKAEKDRFSDETLNPNGNIMLKSTGSDYSSQIMNKT